MLGSIPLHGICATHVSGEPSRYRSLPAGCEIEVISHGHQGLSIPEYFCACEPGTGRIYADYAQILIVIARPLYAKESFGVDLEQSVYALDSTIIDLCFSLFPWAQLDVAAPFSCI